jgi:hypothetical protein
MPKIIPFQSAVQPNPSHLQLQPQQQQQQQQAAEVAAAVNSSSNDSVRSARAYIISQLGLLCIIACMCINSIEM